MKYLSFSIMERIAELNTRNKNRVSPSFLLMKGSIGTFALIIISSGLGFVISLALARILGANGYGVYAYAIAWVGLLGMPAVMGFDKLLVRYFAIYYAKSQWGLMRGLMRRANQVVFVVSVTLMILAAYFGWVLASSTGSTMLHALWFALVLLPVTSHSRLLQSAMQALQRVVLGKFPELLIQPLLFILLIVAVYFLFDSRFSPRWAIALNVLAAAVAFGFSAYLLQNALPEEAKNAVPVYETQRWIRSALPLLLLDSMFVINSYTDIIMLGAIMGERAAGIYTVANRTASLAAFVLVAVNTAFGPIIARLYAAGEMVNLQRQVTYSARLILFFSLPIVLVLVLFGGWMLLLFGPDFAGGQTCLIVLSIGQLVNAGAGSVGLLLIMTGHEREAAWGISVSAAANLILNALLIPRWGIEGAAVATAGSMILWNVMLAWIVWRRLGIQPTAIGLIRTRR